MIDMVDVRGELDELLGLVEMTGRDLSRTAVLISEHGGTRDELADILARYGRIGDSMVAAADRTRAKLARDA